MHEGETVGRNTLQGMKTETGVKRDDRRTWWGGGNAKRSGVQSGCIPNAANSCRIASQLGHAYRGTVRG